MTNAKPYNYAASFFSLYKNADEKNKASLLKNLAKNLVKTGKGKIFIEQTINQIETLLEESEGIKRIKIDTQELLTGAKKESIAKSFEKKLGIKKVIIDNFLDERNIAGMKLTIGDTVYDYTLKNRLDKLQERLTK